MRITSDNLTTNVPVLHRSGDCFTEPETKINLLHLNATLRAN